ncbi:MAG: ribosome silencing factor [Bacteroidales bacterium]|nr:ribosome silencing factor [Bacteroidales bacterium]
MVIEKTLEATEVLKDEIIKGIQEKKGLDITCLNLAKINSTVCDYFVVCHGTSNTHVNAIAESIEDQVSKQIGIKPSRKEGFANAEWILLDYLDVVVHIFQQHVREYYNLEDLWADAPAVNVKE